MCGNKTKINNLPGGITKVIEGITYGNAPSSESVDIFSKTLQPYEK